MTEDVLKMIEEYDRISAKAHKLRRMEMTEAAIDSVSASPFAIDHAHVEPGRRSAKKNSDPWRTGRVDPTPTMADEIVAVLAEHYGEPKSTVIEWIKESFEW